MKKKSNMSDVEYLMHLRNQHEEMKTDIINCCKENQKPMSIFQVYQYMEKRYHVERIEEREEDLILQGLCRNLLSILTACGRLEEKQTNNKTVYRIVEKAERKVA